MLVAEAERSRSEPDPDSWDEPMHVRIYFRGDRLDEYELRRVLERDLKYASGALISTLLVCWFQFRSLFLALMSALLLTMTVLITYVVVPVPKVGLASFLAVFLIYALGTHSLFRLHASWRHWQMQAATLPLTDRLLAVHQTAILQLLPLVMSALCFYVCLYALLRPLREFGLIMGAGMLLTSVLSVAIFIPTLLLHETAVRPLLELSAPRGLALVLEPTSLRLPWRRVAVGIFKLVGKPKPVFLGTAAAFLVAFIAVVAVAATRDSTGVPELFPPGHNRNAGRLLADHFTPTRLAVSQAPPAETIFCEPGRQLTNCGLHWCEAPPAAGPSTSPSDATQCSCYRTSASGTGLGCANITVSTLFSGQSFAALTDGGRAGLLDAYLRDEFGRVGAPEFDTSQSAIHLPSLVLEHWESGVTDIEPLLSMPPVRIRNTQTEATAVCTETAVCHCGVRVCNAPDGFTSGTTVRRRLSPAQPGASGPTPGQDRRLALQAPTNQRGTEVVVVFGIVPPVSSKFLDGKLEWSFDASFDPLSPWTQRAMYAVCSDIPAELNVLQTRCWISGFRRWLLNRGEQFPVKRFDDFHGQVQRYIAEDRMASADLWLDGSGNIRATSFHMEVGLRSGSAEVLEDQRRWRTYVAQRNSEAASTANQAWATSQVWVEMEARDEALASAWRVCLLIVAAVIVAGLVYTMDFEIVGCLAAITFVACTLLLFFMLCIFQWQFGPWELVIMTLFLSYSVEPALQIGRDFVLPPPEADIVGNDSLPEGSGGGDGGGAAIARLEPPPPVDGLGDPGADGPGACAGAGAVNTTGTLLGVSCASAPGGTPGPGSPGPSPVLPEGTASKASIGQDPASALERSVCAACETIAPASIMLVLCGVMLLPCEFRLFTELGALAVLVPFVWVPGALLLLPAAILLSGRARREPDAFLLWRLLEKRFSAMLA